MLTEAGVRSCAIVLAMLLGLTACPTPSSSGSTRAPRGAATGQEQTAHEAVCRTPQSFQRLGPGPHGEPRVPQMIQCNPARIQISMPSMEQEWLLVRDAQAPNRLLGFLVLHRRQAIVRYPFEQLAIEGVAQDWTDLTSRIARGVQASKAGVDALALQDPTLRFPSYRVWTLKAWRAAKHAPPAGHHHGPGGHHHVPETHEHEGGRHGPDGHQHPGAGGHHHGPETHEHDGGRHGPDGHHHGNDIHGARDHHHAEPKQGAKLQKKP